MSSSITTGEVLLRMVEESVYSKIETQLKHVHTDSYVHLTLDKVAWVLFAASDPSQCLNITREGFV